MKINIIMYIHVLETNLSANLGRTYVV